MNLLSAEPIRRVYPPWIKAMLTGIIHVNFFVVFSFPF